MTENINESYAKRPQRKPLSERNDDRFKQIRQWLNIIFMLGAIIGVIVWYATDYSNIGIIIILASMVFKFIEAALRIIR